MKNIKDLIVGKKYKAHFPWGEMVVFYDGYCNNLCGQVCTCCARELEEGYYFKKPVKDTTTYKECCNGVYSESIAVGSTCIEKVKFEEV